MTAQAVTTTEQPRRRDIQSVIDPMPILDTARFEHMVRIASTMARCSLLPDHLTHIKDPNDDKKKIALTYEEVVANAFYVVNVSTHWNMDPFVVAQCMSLVHGKPCFEGKLISALIESRAGIRLFHHFTGDPARDEYRIYLSDKEFTADLIAELKPGFKKLGWRLWDGSVAEWKTSVWAVKNYPRMLIYRGTRDWTRIYEPGILLGVYTDDELEDLQEDARARRAAPAGGLVPASQRISAQASGGFRPGHTAKELGDADTIDNETGEIAANQAEKTSDTDSGAANGQVATSKNAGQPDAEDKSSQPGASGEEPRSGSEAPDKGVETTNEPAGPSSSQETAEGGDAPSPSQESNAAAEGASKESSTGTSSPPSASGGEQGERTGGPSAGPLPAQLKEYSDALGRANAPKSLQNFDADFRNANAWTTDDVAKDALRKVYQVHLNRVKSVYKGMSEIAQALADAGVVPQP